MEHKAPFITSSSSSPSASAANAAPHLEDQQLQKAPRRRHILSRKLYILLAVLVTLIIVGLAVGLGVGLTRKQNNSNQQGAGSSQQTDPTKPSISNSSYPSDSLIATGMGVTPSKDGVWQPPVNASWQIVLSSPLQLDLNSNSITPNVDVWDIDMFTNSKETIDHLHALGKRVVCYFSAGSYEPNRPDSDRFQSGDKGGELNGWPGEYWLKVSSPNVRSIMADRIATASQKGCDAIDPDNVDGYSNTENGLGLTEQDSIDYINFLSDTAAKYNIATGLKNAGAIIPNVLDKVHFSVNEQCVEYSECSTYAKFIDNNKPVFHIEYPKGDSDNNDAAVASTESNTVCNQQGKAAGTYDFSTTIKNMNLDGWVQYCNGALAVTPCTSNNGASSYSGGTGSSTGSSGSSDGESPSSYPEAPSSYPQTPSTPTSAAPQSYPDTEDSPATSLAAVAVTPASYPDTGKQASSPAKAATSTVKAASPSVPAYGPWKSGRPDCPEESLAAAAKKAWEEKKKGEEDKDSASSYGDDDEDDDDDSSNDDDGDDGDDGDDDSDDGDSSD